MPITKAVFDHNERQAIVEPLDTGWVVQGPKVAEFERAFAEFCGAKFAKAVSSCTTALEVSLVAMGIGPGDKVIVPSLTYIASANVVEHIGATPVFCDIKLDTFNIDPVACRQLLEKHGDIKAIMPVNLFGLCAELDSICTMADEFGALVIEDSACGFDAWLNNKHSGMFGHVGCFSFHPRKAITTGEGGMIVTDDLALYEKISQLCDHGAAKSDFARHTEKGGSRLPDFAYAGYNFRMTDFQGALGVCQMNKAKEIMSGRRKVAAWYDEALANHAVLQTPKIDPGYLHAYQSYVCLYTGGRDLGALTVDMIDEINKERNAFMDELESRGIATRQGTHAVHTLRFYREKYSLAHSDYLFSYAADRLSITLPLYAQMTRVEFNYVLENISQLQNVCASV